MNFTDRKRDVISSVIVQFPTFNFFFFFDLHLKLPFSWWYYSISIIFHLLAILNISLLASFNIH